MKVEKALDWHSVSIDLKSQLNTTGYNTDLNKLYKNIEGMVSDLSKLEVSFRRTGKCQMLDNKINDINNAINHLEKLILMAKLMQ